MNVSLTPQLERLVQKKVKSGNYQSASEVVREALRLMQQRDARLEQHTVELRRAVEAGVHELEQGKGIEIGDSGLQEFFDDIKSRGRQRLARRKKK